LKINIKIQNNGKRTLSILHQNTCTPWFKDEPRSGRPITKTTSENIELVRKVIEEDPHCNYEDIEAATLLSHGTINRIIHEHLNKKKLLLVEFLINKRNSESNFIERI